MPKIYGKDKNGVWTPTGGGSGGGVQVDETLSKAGYAADAAAVGDALNKQSKAIANKTDKAGWTPDKYIGTDENGNLIAKDAPVGGGTGTVKSVNGNAPDENGNVTVEVGQPTDEQISNAVETWLDEHPEATTTVADGSITREKMSDNAVAPNNTTFFNETTRVFWSGTVTSQTKIDVSGRTTAFMRMHPNGSGCKNNTVAKYAVTKIEYFDSNNTVTGTIDGNPLSCDATNADGIYTITKTLEIPADTSYVIFTINNYYGGTPTLILATEEIVDDEDITFTIVGRYKEFVAEEIVESAAFVGAVDNAVTEGKSETLKYVAENYLTAEPSGTSNILDYTDLVEGFITYNETKGIYYDTTQTWCVDMYSTKPLPVEANTEYSFVAFTDETIRHGVSAVLELDSDMNYVNYTQTSTRLTKLTTQETTAYIVTTYTVVGMENIWIGKSTEVPLYYIPYAKKVTDQTIFVPEKNIISGLSGKKWNALGDSWTEGDTGYVSRIAEKTGMTARNYGIVSSTISEMGDGGYEPMCVRYANMDDDADLVTVMGGINDHNSAETGVDYGEIDSTDTSTFYGGWNVLLSGLRKKYPNAIILVFTNGDCYPGTRADAEGRVEAIKKVCAKHRIPCLDILHNIGYTYEDYQTDMIHLTPTQIVNNLTPLVYNFIKWHFMT